MKIKKTVLILIVLLTLPMISTNVIKSNTMINIHPNLYSCSDSPDLSLSQSTLPYSKTGTINENGDEYWDNNEIDIIRYVVPAGETFDVELHTSSSAELWIFYGSISNFDDVETALDDLMNDGSSSRVLAWDYTSAGYASFSYTLSSKTDKNIAIFSYSSSNPSSMSYTLYTSVEVYSPPPPATTAPSSSGSSSDGTISPLLFIGIMAVMFYIAYKIRKSRKERKADKIQYRYDSQPQSAYDSQQYSPTQPTYQQPSQPTYQQPSSEPSKSEYQPPSIGRCNQCDSEISGDNVFCTNCGNRVY
jgi:hypothetical protein